MEEDPKNKQGIFSSSDLSVDTETLPPELGGPQPDAKSARTSVSPAPTSANSTSANSTSAENAASVNSAQPDPASPNLPSENNSERVASIFGAHLGRPGANRPSAANGAEDHAALTSDASTRNNSDAARVTSALANTDASARMGAITEAMTAQNSTQSTATGDIRLSGAKKRRKAPLIITLLVLLAAAGTVTALFLTGVIGPRPTKEPLTAFERYLNLVKYGPEEAKNPSDGDRDTEDWFIFAPGDLSDKEWLAFSDDVYKAYDSFLEKDSGIIEGDFPEYAKVLGAVLNSTNLSAISDELLNVFVNQGSEAALRYVNETTPEVGDGTFYFTSAGRVADALEEYLRSSFSLYEAYDSVGCVDGNATISYTCLEDENPTTTIAELLEQQSDLISTIYEYRAPMREHFQSESERLLETLKELYEK